MIRPVLGLAAASRAASAPASALRRQPLSLDIQPPSRLRSRPGLFLGCFALRPCAPSWHPTALSRSFFCGPPRWSDPQRHINNYNKSNDTPSPPPETNINTSTEDPIPIPTTITPPPPPTPIWQRLGPLTTAANAYAGAQQRRPWATQFLTALVIYLLADLSAQSISADPYDPARTARNLTIGGASAIPTYYWFLFLSHNFNYASSRLLSLGVKILINLAVFTPLFNAYFFGAQAFLATGSLGAVVDRIVFAVPPSTLNSWKFWPWVTAFNFWCVPMHYRSVFAGTISIGWQTYLAWLNRMAELAAAKKAGAATGVVVDVKEEKGVVEVADVE